VITQPFEFEKHLRPPPRSFDVFFYVNVGVLALFLTLFTSKFVLAPGPRFELPVVPNPLETAQVADLVVNLQRDNLILFEGGRYSMDGFKQRLGEVVAAKGATRLLLRVDKQTSAQALVTFTSVATAAGCDVQIAAEAPAAGN
jgi:biopolymer transport protein ExbD